MDQLLSVAREFIVWLEAYERPFVNDEHLDIELIRHRARSLGLWAPHLPKDHGGLGLSLTDFAQLSEILGRSPLGHLACNCQAPDIGNMELLLEYGSESQQRQFFEPLASGQVRSCFAMTEPHQPGSNPTMLAGKAEKDGSDYVINAHKWFASSADGSAFAIVMAKTNPEAKPYQQYSQILVPTDTPGFERVRNIPVMGHVGSGYFSHAEVRFTDCRVPQSHLIGEEGSGFALAQQRLGPGRIHHCMRWIGIAQRALDISCTYAQSRAITPDEVLADRQVVRHALARSHAEIQASRLMVLDAAGQVDRLGTRGARVAISTIKFFVAGMLQRVLDRAIQIHGALGLTDETLLSYWYRHERAARIYDGPDEVHMDVVARDLLKKS